MKSTVVWLLFALVCTHSLRAIAEPGDANPTESPRAAVPDAAASQPALKAVKELFQTEYAKAKLAADKKQLAAQLMQVARDTQDDPTSRYILLVEAQRLATEAGEVSLVLQAVETAVKEYQLDPVQTKAKALASVNERSLSLEDRTAVSEAALALMPEAVAADQYDVAKQIGATALTAARQSKDLDLVKRVAAIQANLEETARAYLQAKTAFTTLKDHPADPQANTTAGSFACFYKGDWASGLTMLAKSDNLELQALAREEISPNPAALTLADGWWTVAESKKGRTADNIKMHAIEWYEQALPTATGLVKTKIEKRLSEAGDLANTVNDRSWLVIFRSDDPTIWNSDVKDGPTKLAMSLNKVPDDIAWVRISLDKKNYVVVPITKARLGRFNEDDERFNWNGSKEEVRNARHLGIYDKEMAYRKGGDVFIKPLHRRGWGFGMRAYKDDHQGYGWQGEPLERTVFEISVKPGRLSSEDHKHLLGEQPQKQNDSKTGQSTRGAPKANVLASRKTAAPDAVKIGNHYYKVFLVAKPWDEASKICKQMGGYLACAETEAEQNELAKLKGKSMVWVGGYRKVDKFVWINNEEPIPSNRFKGNEPKDGYLSFSTIALDKLVARKPDEAQIQGFICEWDD